MKLKRGKLEKFDPEHKSPNDKRKKETWAVFSYFDEDGQEYRKSFTAPANTHELTMWKISPQIIVR